MPLNLNEFMPINELNKQEMIVWLNNTLTTLTDPNFDWGNPNINRIFGTDRDDIDEVIDMFGRFLRTLVDYNLFQK